MEEINIKDDDKKARINDEIVAKDVRLIDQDGEQVGVVSLNEALKKADEAGLDLVEIASGAKPPVCRIMNYGKYLFEQRKQKAEAKKKQKRVQLKEIKLRPGTEEADYQVKLRNLIRFLEDGDKAKITLRFRGREMVHQQIGLELMKRIETDLQEYSSVEQHPRLEGKQMVMVLTPKGKK